MDERGWLTPWPAWRSTWYGLGSRVAAGVGGAGVGVSLLWLASFAANFKRAQADWDAESMTVLVAGVTTIASSVAVAIRPAKLTVALTVGVWLVIPIIGLAI